MALTPEQVAEYLAGLDAETLKIIQKKKSAVKKVKADSEREQKLQKYRKLAEEEIKGKKLNELREMYINIRAPQLQKTESNKASEKSTASKVKCQCRCFKKNWDNWKVCGKTFMDSTGNPPPEGKEWNESVPCGKSVVKGSVFCKNHQSEESRKNDGIHGTPYHFPNHTSESQKVWVAWVQFLDKELKPQENPEPPAEGGAVESEIPEESEGEESGEESEGEESEGEQSELEADESEE